MRSYRSERQANAYTRLKLLDSTAYAYKLARECHKNGLTTAQMAHCLQDAGYSDVRINLVAKAFQ